MRDSPKNKGQGSLRRRVENYNKLLRAGNQQQGYTPDY